METKNKIVQYLLIISTFFLIVFISASGQAATHYVSPSGSATWANSTNINTPSSLDTADSNATAGDTVYLRGGTYTSRFIISNSGSSGNPIAFARYRGEVPTLKYSSHNAIMDGKSYILLDGLTFSGGGGRQVYIYNSSSYVEVKNCTFGGNSGGPALHVRDSNYAYIHNNTFNAQAEATGEENEKDTIALFNAKYCRIINNAITDGGGHSAIMVTNNSAYNVIRGNTITVTSLWTEDNSALDTAITALKNSPHNLFENNIIHDQTGLANTGRSEGLKNHASSYNIWRKNIVYNWDRYGWGCYTGSSSTSVEYNTIYNNTFYNVNLSGTSYGSMDINAGANADAKYNQFVNNLTHTTGRYGFSLYYSYASQISDNQIRYNIFYNIPDADVRRFNETSSNSEAQTLYPSEFQNNRASEPTFTNAASGDFTALNSSAIQIDAGGYLTTITSPTGFGDSFTVNNCYFFFDGSGIPGETGDTIKTQNGQSATITSINYSTGAIKVSSSIHWTNGEGIGLYYEGIRPDIGVFEYSDNPFLSAPTGLNILAN